MKKKAFTLVELLAVIVVLAVILAIAIPSITNIIASSKKASFKSDARFILDQTRIELSKNDTFDPTTINMDTLGNYNISNENYDLMSVSMIDSKPYIYVVGKNKWDGYKACGTYNNMQVVPITDTETCQEPVLLCTAPVNPTTDESCFGFDSATGIISSYDGSCTMDVGIPSTIGGIAVTAIGDEAFLEQGLTSVTLPDSITTIGYDSFGLNQLECISLPDSLTSIGDYAFESNILSSIIIPNSVTYLGEGAFGWNSLTSAVIPSGITEILGSTFSSNRLTNITIPSSVTSIGYDSFGSNQLSSIIIPTSVESISNNAFSSNLFTKITIDGVETRFNSNWGPIGFPMVLMPGFDVSMCYEFDSSTGTITNYTYGCPSDVNIPSTIGGVNVTTIGDQAFSNYNLSSVTIPNTVTTIGKHAFSYNKITNISVPSSVTFMGESAFNNNLLPDNQAYIYARNNDGSINSTTLVSYGGAKRSNIVIPGNITTIGNAAFMYNDITSITIPNTVTTIGSSAFSKNKLASITIPNTVNAISYDTFQSNLLTSITVPTSVTWVAPSSFNDNQLSDANAFIYDRNGDGTNNLTRLASYGGAKRSNVIIPSNIVTIGYCSFCNTNLSSVTIPSSVTTIISYAFMGCQLTSITIPASVTTIEDNAFAYNVLTSVTIQGDATRFNSRWEIIGFPLNLKP